MNTWHVSETVKPSLSKMGDGSTCRVSSWIIGKWHPEDSIMDDHFAICRYWEDGKLSGWEVYSFDWLDSVSQPDEWYDFEYRRDV